MSDSPMPDPKAYWDDVYRTRRATSSGQPSGALLRYVRPLEAGGRALDLGSSNGDDVLWLARQGWQTLGVDISEVAVARATAQAAAAGLSERARFEARDLSQGLPEGPFDLITALFFQSSDAALGRPAILAEAAAKVAPGGHILVVAHAAPPPWAPELPSRPHFPTVDQELDALQADSAQWRTKVATLIARDAKDREGAAAVALDSVVLLQRRA